MLLNKVSKLKIINTRNFVTSLHLNKSVSENLQRMLRVDHAGESGAVKIYEGQLAVLGKTDIGPMLEEMKGHEVEHLKKFNELLPEYRTRPTVFLPLWSVAAYALGAGTALMGKESAMACTVAVETVIGEHYDNQLRELINEENGEEKHAELLKVIKQFRDEEMHHHDIGIEYDAEKAPCYEVLTQVIKGGCKAAIWISEKV